MPRFFVPQPLTVGGQTVLDGADARHIAGALRMTVGETLTLCDGQGTDYDCTLIAVERDAVSLTVDAARPNLSEPTLKVTLYMGLPKADKMEWVLQKAVELGVIAVVPVVMTRSIARPDARDADKKRERWQRIADEAAGQSGRGILPTVEPILSWRQAAARLCSPQTLLCYEKGGQPLGEAVSPAETAVNLVVGPEGGIDPAEVAAIRNGGGRIVTLGPRILRCETAPLAALTVLMERTGNMK